MLRPPVRAARCDVGLGRWRARLVPDAYRWLVPVAVLAVAAGWLWTSWQGWSTKRRPARRTLVVMVFATAMMVIVLLWPTIEPVVIAMLRR